MEKDHHHSHQVALIRFDAHVFHLHIFSGEYWKQEISGLLNKVDIGQFIDHNAWIDFWSIVSSLYCRKSGLWIYNHFYHFCRYTDVPCNHVLCHISYR